MAKKTSARTTKKNALKSALNQPTQGTSETPATEQSTFDKNIAALLMIDPVTAIRLKNVKPNEKFELFVTSDPVNMNIIDKENFKPIFTTNPVEETLKKVQELDSVQLYPHLYFFGVGNGVLYRMLLNQNQKLQHLVIVEPEPEILFNVLHFFDFSEEIKTRRIEFHLTENVSKIVAEYIFGYKDSALYCKLYDFRLFNGFYANYSEEYLRINKLFTEVIESIVISLGNDSNDSVIGLLHQCLNMPQMLAAPSYQSFVKCARNTRTAIIVSTGPSLHKQLPTLKKIAPYCTLYCIDASFPILAKAGIKPDVVLTLERVRESAKFYTDTPKEAQEGVIFAITSIAHENTLNAITEGQKILPMRPFPYTFYFDVPEYGYTGLGMSAANMAYETIRHVGYENIVFIGQDLAFAPDGTSHAKGAVYGEREISMDTDKKNKKENIDIEAYGGNGMVKTTYVWRLFLKYLEIEIFKTPKNIKIFNCTEGGARIHGTEEIPFEEIYNNIDKSQAKQPILLEETSQKDYEKLLRDVKRKVEKVLLHGYKQKEKIEKVFLEICALTEELEKLNAEKQLEKVDFKKINRLVEKINAVKDGFISNPHTRIFDNIVQSYIMHQEMELTKITTLVVRTDEEAKARQVDWIYKHKYWFFSLAGGIHTVLAVLKKACGQWMEIPEKYRDEEEDSKVSTKDPHQVKIKGLDVGGILKI